MTDRITDLATEPPAGPLAVRGPSRRRVLVTGGVIVAAAAATAACGSSGASETGAAPGPTDSTGGGSRGEYPNGRHPGGRRSDPHRPEGGHHPTHRRDLQGVHRRLHPSGLPGRLHRRRDDRLPLPRQHLLNLRRIRDRWPSTRPAGPRTHHRVRGHHHPDLRPPPVFAGRCPPLISPEPLAPPRSDEGLAPVLRTGGPPRLIPPRQSWGSRLTKEPASATVQHPLRHTGGTQAGTVGETTRTSVTGSMPGAAEPDPAPLAIG